MLVLALLITIIEMIPLLREKKRKEGAVLLLLSAITLAYGYYYNTHIYTASLINTLFQLYGIR